MYDDIRTLCIFNLIIFIAISSKIIQVLEIVYATPNKY